MDLIYTDKEWEDLGILTNYKLDLAYGIDENDFELTSQISLQTDSILYVEDSEIGGIIDSIFVDTKDGKVKYKGRSFHGVLNSKVIEPHPGQDYYTVSGSIIMILREILIKLKLQSICTVDKNSVNKSVSIYQFDRYVYCYDGLVKFLKSQGLKLKLYYKDKRIVLKAENIVDYSKNEELDSSQLNFKVEKNYNKVNHVIALGKGELKNRLVKHLYFDENGKNIESQKFQGKDEIVYIYDYSSAESETELVKSAIQKYEELKKDKLDTTLNEKLGVYDIGDIVGARENTMDIFISKRIVKKIISMKNDEIKINYKVGD